MYPHTDLKKKAGERRSFPFPAHDSPKIKDLISKLIPSIITVWLMSLSMNN